MVMALEGIRVLDFTRAQFGPYATVMLGDMGAEIWKVENIEGGDLGRDVPWLYGDPPYNTYFNALNRNKKSIALNFRNPEGREIALKLSEMCDVVLHNFRPGVMEAFRLTYEDFKARNEKIIYCSICAWSVAKRGSFSICSSPMALQKRGHRSSRTEARVMHLSFVLKVPHRPGMRPWPPPAFFESSPEAMYVDISQCWRAS